MKELGLLCLFCALERMPGVALRYQVFRKIITDKQKKLLFVSYLVCFLISTLLCVIVWKSGRYTNQYYRSSFAVFGAVMVLVNICIIRGRFWEHLFSAGLSMCLILMVITVSAYVVNQAMPLHHGTWTYINNALFTSLIGWIAYPLFHYLMVNTITSFLVTESRYYWKRIWMMPCLLYVGCASALPVDETLLTLRHVQIAVLLTGAAAVMCYCVATDFEKLQVHYQYVEMLNRQKEYYEQLSERVEEARKTRHDFKNHLMAIRGFMERDDKEGLRRYCDEIQIQKTNTAPIPYTGNAAADGVIYHYMQVTEEAGIEFHMSGVFGKHGIADMDLCVLLGNALDNAVAACQQMDVMERYIDLSVQRDGNVLAIMIRNSFDGVVLEDDGKILSRKRKNRTGVGISSMKAICKKYQGTFQTRYTETEFSCLMLLNETVETQ